METKLLYLEAFSRRENIKFMNIAVDSTEEREDAEETLRSFLEHDLGLLDNNNNNNNNNNLLLIERYLQLQINSALHLMSLNIKV